jgi:anaerobic magnesium-protoporphyrin IX monomethyl ester cyclase
MRILLTTLNAKYIHINLAIRLLYDLNHQNHSGLEWKEFTIKEDRDEIADHCKDFDIVAFSCYIWNITQTLEVVNKIKERNPNVKILLGGPEVSYDWQDVISVPAVDYIITGEGEIPFKAFLENFPDVEHLPNVISKKENAIVCQSKTEQFDLTGYKDSLFYKYDKPETLENRVLYIETSRGCPYKCEFCLASLDNVVRYLPMENIKANLLYMMQHGKVIKFLDRTFNVKKAFTIEIFQFILDNYRPQNVFQFEITADILHPDIVQFIHDKVPHGLFRFEIGIQTVNQKANLEVSRKQNFDKTVKIIKTLDYKVEMHLDLIVGMALDYWDDIKYSFEEVFKLYAPELQLGFLKFLKGTPVRHKAEQHGFVYDPNPPYQIIESNYLTRDELYRIEILENALEIYWNKHRAQRTLRYVCENYSIFDFLLGLGTLFGEKREFHKYALLDVYETLNEYVEKSYPNDSILKEMIALDYYLFYKVKPKTMFLDEVNRIEKYALLDKLKLNHQKNRYFVLPLSFDFEVFEKENRIELTETPLILLYNGLEKAKPHLNLPQKGRLTNVMANTEILEVF